MARSDLVIKIDVKDMRAFRIACDALREIVGAEADTDDPDTRDRAYGIGREIAEDALAEIDAVLLAESPRPDKAEQ